MIAQLMRWSVAIGLVVLGVAYPGTVLAGETQCVTAASSPVHTQPSSRSALIKTKHEGDPISVQRRAADGWYAVDVNGRTAPGYMPARTLGSCASALTEPDGPYSGPGFGFGVQVHAEHQHLPCALGPAQEAGYQWVKQQVQWWVAEYHRGRIDWPRLDGVVHPFHERGIKVMLSVLRAPDWARAEGEDKNIPGPPADPQAYAAFLANLAARYCGQVGAIEVWNEPNFMWNWGGRQVSAADYMRYLKAAYPAIKQACRSTQVISAGLMVLGGANNGISLVDDLVYLEQLYRNGLARYSDGVGAHPYGFNNPPWDALGQVTGSYPGWKGHRSFFFRSTLKAYRRVMVRHGDGEKRIWPTEFGWPTVESTGAFAHPGFEYAGQVTESDQANWTVWAFNWLRQQGWIGPSFQWNLNFAGVAGNRSELSAFGILYHDGRPRPAFWAVKGMGK